MTARTTDDQTSSLQRLKHVRKDLIRQLNNVEEQIAALQTAEKLLRVRKTGASRLAKAIQARVTDQRHN